MDISYRYQGETRTRQMEQRCQAADLLKVLDIPPDAVLLTLQGADGLLQPIALTRRLEEGDRLELVTIASGG